jgi:hypothetical protein
MMVVELLGLVVGTGAAVVGWLLVGSVGEPVGILGAVTFRVPAGHACVYVVLHLVLYAGTSLVQYWTNSGV